MHTVGGLVVAADETKQNVFIIHPAKPDAGTLLCPTCIFESLEKPFVINTTKNNQMAVCVVRNDVFCIIFMSWGYLLFATVCLLSYKNATAVLCNCYYSCL